MRKVTVRKFEELDVPNKVKWINDDRNNQFLHYDIPLNIEKTRKWYFRVRSLANRYDAVIECDGVPVGVIGLLNIQDGNAEYYVTLGEPEYKGLGIAKRASAILLRYAFCELKLDEVYLYTEVDNVSAQHLFEKCGFHNQGIRYASALNRGKMVERYYYTMTVEEYMRNNCLTNRGGYYSVVSTLVSPIAA